MNGTQIGVLVAMCVVFLLVASLLVFILLRLGRQRRADQKSTDAEAQEGSGRVLHFFDLFRTPRSLDLQAMSITDAKSLQSALAAACGMPDGTSLTLLCVDEVGRSVVMDLDRLVFPDEQLELRMRHTEGRPLLLAEEDKPLTPTPATYQQEVPVRQNYNTEIDVTYARDGGRLPRLGGASQTACSNGAVPPPVILPLSSRISSATPVSITAARYVVQGGGGALGKDAAAFVEAAMMGSTRCTVTLPYGARVIVEPNARAAWLLDENNRSAGAPLLREAAEAVRYTVDNMSSVQWCPYTRPFYLPPGRWCIRAESSTADHRCIETVSRVFTVDIVPQNR
ncbi:uncharacterized protein Tco025E_01348 [Trypanosoma conorhini]|uniref:Uncharacterized protein n=1 Tax=Trypanosoma conorhini TaxID=83891 RepID=A0A3R7N782_9TRYP|nr:uncharacterized protein Tco025E_01348 [Trypanosoma conorhini]RNF26578.1 hypothetical protein Tco025E_01348 [Trypanosoma conorhini]